jgi:outer membrane protein OmpA-like peptidoglycan-associated protein
MKKFNFFLYVIAPFLVVFNLQAQDERNSWAFFIGTNAVDFYPINNNGFISGERLSGSLFSEFFNANDHWNTIPSVSYLEVQRYVGDGFSARLTGSINKIDRLGDISADDLSFYNIGAGVQYNFKNLINTTIVDPFVGVGAGYYWIENNGASTFDSDLGANFWFTDNIAFTVKTSFKTAFEDNNFDYFQHSAGLTIAFGGTDSDGDGVYDKNDVCPDVPGLAEFSGCPDSDGDGITDKDDKCPNTAGLEEFDGCADSDSDGIADPDDECPNEAGPKANKGCPYPDTDGDSVLDKDDVCPNVAGTQVNNGCPEIQKELKVYTKTINFETGKTTISKDSEEALTGIIAILDEYPNAKFSVEGHTDSIGSVSDNESLSKARATTVESYLVENGIGESRLSSAGYGEQKPVASNDTKTGRAENRRVEINLKK